MVLTEPEVQSLQAAMLDRFIASSDSFVRCPNAACVTRVPVLVRVRERRLYV
jgi:hypothetical protein